MIARLLSLAKLGLPWWGRWAMIAALAVALVGWGYLRGFLHEEHKFDAYQAQVDALAKEAAARAAERKAEQDENTKEIRDGYEADVALIDAYYAAQPPRVVRVPARGGAVPAAADRAVEPHGAACEPAAPRPDPELEQRCALDAARINRWREFAEKNGLPIER